MQTSVVWVWVGHTQKPGISRRVDFCLERVLSRTTFDFFFVCGELVVLTKYKIKQYKKEIIKRPAMGSGEQQNTAAVASQSDEILPPNLDEEVNEELDRLGQGGRWVW